MPLNTVIEILATLFGLCYIVLLIQEKILCWLFGIAGSLLSVYLFIATKLYSEAFLYSYYVVMGAWGWIHWARRERAHDNPVTRYRAQDHLLVIAVAALGALALGSFFAHASDAQRPYIDAFTTSFSFAATYMQVKKVLENWYYWIVLNGVSIWLYMDRSLDIYAMLIFVYAGLSILGLYQWLRAWDSQRAAEPRIAVGARSAGD